jgi:4-hydroxyphenylacetate decarboxylase small subunit
MTAKFNHRDCRNFAPIDVSKGICHVSKDIVLADTEQCASFNRTPKCNNCKRFDRTTGELEMGTCLASTHDPKYFAYPDMVAVTCGEYQAS